MELLSAWLKVKVKCFNGLPATWWSMHARCSLARWTVEHHSRREQGNGLTTYPLGVLPYWDYKGHRWDEA